MLKNLQVPVRLEVGNFMGTANFGSFAFVGDQVSDSPIGNNANRYLALEIGEACQLKCRHCIYHRSKSKTPKPNSRILDEVATCLSETLDPIWVTLAGKEPTLFPDSLVKTARQVSAPDRVNVLMTNGLLLHDSLVEELEPFIDLFDISLDGTRAAHDWMRGEGTFDGTLDRIRHIVDNTQARVGIIGTAVHAELDDGTPQNKELVALARQIVEEFGDSGRVVFSASLYYGFPDDPMRLTANDLVELIAGLRETDCPTRIIYAATYSQLWPRVSRALGVDARNIKYDTQTGFPVVQLGSVQVILFNLSPFPQVSARVSNDGHVYLSCNHLVLGDDAEDIAIADLSVESVEDVFTRLRDGTHDAFRQFAEIPEDCHICSDYDSCKGGDRLSGVYFNGQPVDPFCEQIRRH